MSPGERAAPAWVAAAAVALFVVYASNFLYFFVDDEGIPFVYAQNLLNGHGLSYTPAEPPVEGYSDFLHVGLATLILAVDRVAHLPKIAVFFIGKGISLAAGIVIVCLVASLSRRVAATVEGTAAGLGGLALAGPLAAWSCSSLETAPFALSVLVLAAALAAEADRVALAAAAVVLLQRVDGFVYVGALLGVFWILSDRSRGGEIRRRIIAPAALLFVAYQAWRLWYFRDLLPLPLQSKVLYKLASPSNIVVKAPDLPYWRAFVQVYGWPATAALAVAGTYAVLRGGVVRALAIAAAILTLYVSVVGDWMFGFRFYVALIPFYAVIAAHGVGALSPRWLRTAAAAVVLVLAGAAALRFVRAYEEKETVSFLRAPSLDASRFFSRYYGVYRIGRDLMPPGDSVSYNQAGFVAFMLDLDNVDTLGICSRFYAELPATDVFFTEVGRYTPWTPKQVVHARDAYLLYRDTRFLIAPTDLLRHANTDQIPATLLDGFYERVAIDPAGLNAIYARTDRAADSYVKGPSGFRENVAHVSYLRRAALNGRILEARDFLAYLPFFRQAARELRFTGTYTVDVVFATGDEAVYALYIAAVRVSAPAVLRLTLYRADGTIAQRTTTDLTAGVVQPIDATLAPAVRASRLVLEIVGERGTSLTGRLEDVRVQGQTPALERYISSRLTFPSPWVRTGSGQ